MLYLSDTKVTDAGPKELRAHHALVSLRLNSTDVTDAGLDRDRGNHRSEVPGTVRDQDYRRGDPEIERSPVAALLDLQDTLVNDDGLLR